MVFSFSNDTEVIGGHVEFSNNQERSSQVEINSCQGLFTYLIGKVWDIYRIARN